MSLYKGAVRLLVRERVRELEKEKGIEARQITVSFPPKTDLGIGTKGGKTPATVTLYEAVNGKVRKENLVGTFRQTDTHGIWGTNQAPEMREAHKTLFDKLPTLPKGEDGGKLYYAVYEKAEMATVEDGGSLDINLD